MNRIFVKIVKILCGVIVVLGIFVGIVSGNGMPSKGIPKPPIGIGEYIENEVG